MRKMIEVEYVGIEDVQEIIDDAYAVMQEGHYVSVRMSNVSEKPLFLIDIKLGGFEAEREIDYSFMFYISDEESEIKTMNECKSVLKNLLAEG